jgi:hypothetical protein
LTTRRRARLIVWLLCLLSHGLLAGGAAAYYGTDTSGRDAMPAQGIIRFRLVYHNVNQMLLHTSNLGDFGDWNMDPLAPSCEWLAGSAVEYLFAAGLWVGGIVTGDGGRPDTLVSSAVYQLEFRPNPDSLDIVYTCAEGDPGGGRLIDDDYDNLYDEDPLDGYDNDGDGTVDEDFAAISQQMFTSVFCDTSTIMNSVRTGDFHKPPNLKVCQESYAWTNATVEDFVGVEYRVTNIGCSPICKAYVAFMVDADIGPIRRIPRCYLDDMAAFVDTTVSRNELKPDGTTVTKLYHLTMGYMYDHEGGEDGDVPGYLGVMFLGHTTDPAGKLAPEEVRIHTFKHWSGDGQDPMNDKERYRYMRGNSDTETTISAPSGREADYRFLVSAGPFAVIPPGSTLVFQCAFVCGAPFGDLRRSD